MIDQSIIWRKASTVATNRNPVLDLLRDSFDSYDPWGSALSAHFDIAECLYRHGADIPASWEFSTGNSCELDEDADYFATEIDLMLRRGHYSNLIHAGNVLERYEAQCKLAGLDY